MRVAAVAVVAMTVAAFSAGRAAAARPAPVWAIDDGERIGRAATPLPFKSGADNPVWQPGQPIRLLALRDEVVAFQVIVEGGEAPLAAVTVELAPLVGPAGPAGIRADRFVEHFFEIQRASSTAGGLGSLGWAAGSGPPPGRLPAVVPDALIPIELAPPWAPWPMRVAARENGVVWIDLTVPADLPPATYRGLVTVRDGGQPVGTLALELEVLDATLPARPVSTMLFYERRALDRRIGDGQAAERQLWTLFHQHRLAPLHGVNAAADVVAHLPALDGSLYTAARGYTGPAAGVGDGIVVLGTYGTLGDPTPAHLAVVGEIADELAARGLFQQADVVLYAEDEDCRSPRGAGWRALLAAAANPNARRVRVGWTCSEDPAEQPVDVPMVIAGAYDPGRAAAARAAGKETWIYNGFRPATGTMLTDSEAVSLRTDGWIAAMAGIPRWFIWETTFWYDGNRGGHGPYDPFTTAETFHNQDGEAAMGDGVLVYPGRQVDGFGARSLGFAGVVPSIRLKNLRRGVQDAGYYQLARAAARDQAESIARRLLPRILGEAAPGAPPAWGERGKPFFDARRALARLIAPGADPGPTPGVGCGHPRRHLRWRHLIGLALLIAAAALALRFAVARWGAGRSN
jgi:hypothetical protein